jgi:hypothetical protein
VALRFAFPVRTEATKEAEAPVPQARVSPARAPQNAHPDIGFVRVFNKLRIGDGAGNNGWCSKLGTDHGQVKIVNSAYRYDYMRIAHRHGRSFVSAAVYPDFAVDEAVSFHIHGNEFGLKHRLSHVNPDSGHPAFFNREVEGFLSPPRVSTEMVPLPGHFIVVNIFANTADRVSAHFRFGTVGVEHLHAEVRFAFFPAGPISTMPSEPMPKWRSLILRESPAGSFTTSLNRLM